MTYTTDYMISIALLLITCYCGVISQQNKLLKLHSITDLSADEYHQIFTTTYQDESRRNAKHNIHLFDEFGKYIKLSYQSKHPLNTNILKLDEDVHKNNILSLQCPSISDTEQNEIMKLNFKTPFVAQQYYNDIEVSLYHSQKKHFISAGHQWRCKHSNAILNQITQIYLNETEITLHTEHATVTDVFEELSISYETNINHNPYNHNPYIKGYITESELQRRRLGDNLISSIWSSAVHGLSAAIDFIKNIIKDMAVPAINTFIEGKSLEYGPKDTKTSWSWNYADKGKASKSIQIVENITCDNCYAHVDGTYTYHIDIENRKIQYLLMSVEGDTEIGAGISVKGNTSLEKEYRANTPKIPAFSFEVAGITFEGQLYGSIGFAVYGDITEFSFDIASSGRIRKGIEYNRTARHRYNYINEHSLTFDRNAPQLSFEQGEISTYIRAVLYLQFTHIGSFFFGLQPTFHFDIEFGDTDNCVVRYSPSAKTNDFIGADLSAIDWYKKIDFAVHQTNLDNWSGCLDKSQITRNQGWERILHFFSVDGINRRRLIVNGTDDVPSIAQARTYVDYSDVNLMPSFSMDPDEKLSNLWGNLSSIPTLCNNYSEICNGYITHTIVPHIGRLFMTVENGTLFGLYSTLIEIAPSNGWVFLNASMITNVSCTALHQFDLQDTTNYLHTYKVTLLEWYCDVDIAMFGINKTSNPRHHAGWECMISLPSQMDAIASDASFGSMMLFDAPNWCHVFTMSTKQQYILDATKINWNTVQYPLWYGVWDCIDVLNVTEKESTLYFLSYDGNTTETEVIMQLDETETIYFKGYMDLVHMEMQLNAIYWYEKQMFFDDMDHASLQLFGLLRILSDGSIIYAGSVMHKECTGFLFHGYLDFNQLDDTHLNQIISSEEIADEDSFLSTKSVVMFFIGIATCGVIIIFVAMCLQYRRRKSLRGHVLTNHLL